MIPSIPSVTGAETHEGTPNRPWKRRLGKARLIRSDEIPDALEHTLKCRDLLQIALVTRIHVVIHGMRSPESATIACLYLHVKTSDDFMLSSPTLSFSRDPAVVEANGRCETTE